MNLNEQLRILSIFHYVVGGLHALFGSFGLIHFFIGLMVLTHPAKMGSDIPPQWFGLIFMLVGGGFVLFGWGLGLATIISGRFIAKRRKRMFSVVVGAINCAMLPIGTALGVFDIILLTKDETKMQYAEQDAAPNP